MKTRLTLHPNLLSIGPTTLLRRKSLTLLTERPIETASTNMEVAVLLSLPSLATQKPNNIRLIPVEMEGSFASSEQSR